MLPTRICGICLLAVAAVVSFGVAAVAQQGGPKTKGVWTDPKDKTLPEDFKIQGEYVGEMEGSGKLGAQVIALGGGTFQAVLLPGGLPGEGWDEKSRILIDGKLAAVNPYTAVFAPTDGKRKYLAQKAEEFSATTKFPSVGHKDCTATIRGRTLSGKTADGKSFELKKIVRNSPTLGQKPPAGAVVLFDGTNTAEFKGGRLDKEGGILNTDGKDITTLRKFLSYTVHVEFMLAYRPDARGQGRGNSGFYMINLYEVQILDSFGLDGKNNECGGVYQLLAPKVNMCAPPLQWQTYDIDFTSAEMDKDKKRTKKARITAKHNGVVILDNAEINGKTGGARNEPEGTPGVLLLQGHGNPTQFRNLWLVEKK